MDDIGNIHNREESKSDRTFKKLKDFHSKAYSNISQALSLDEENKDGHSQSTLAAVIKQYKAGINDLKKGVLLEMEVTDSNYDKFSKMKQKMMANMIGSQERVDVLEKELSKMKMPAPKRPAPVTVTVRTPQKSEADSKLPIRRSITKPSDKRPSPRDGPPKRLARPKSQTGEDVNQKPFSRSSSADAGASHRRKITAADLKGIDPKLAHAILDEIVDQGTSVTFKDVVGNSVAKEALKTAAILPALRPDLYTGLRTPPKGILFFGPPGNGKTLLAKAVACEANCVFFSISAGSLMSKWVGEAEKLVRTLFHLARQLQPTVIFIDEVDSLLSKRKENEHDVSRRVKTQFLVEMDGVTGKGMEERVLILAATNRPQEIDDAIIRRFSKRIYIGMPDVQTRRHLLGSLLSQHDKVSISSRELDELARLTDNYSASDLTNLAAEAAMEPIRNLPLEELTAVKSASVRAVTKNDFIECLQRIRPSVPTETLAQFHEWNSKYGDVSSS